MNRKLILLPLLLFAFLFQCCKEEDPIPEPKAEKGAMQFSFSHKVDGLPLEFDTMVYTNVAGNEYLVNEIQYFISDVVLHNSNGSNYTISSNNGIHYVDTDIPASHIWQVNDSIPAGAYTSISFTFGINETKNQSGLFNNPPESNMFWPEFLGGGYHYLKLNGKWKDINSQIVPFNFHLGIGQIYANNVIHIDSITGFVQNYFTVQLPLSTLNIQHKQLTKADISMNVNSWFSTPNIWNLNNWGGSIMQNQPAMHAAKENGVDAFSFQLIP